MQPHSSDIEAVAIKLRKFLGLRESSRYLATKAMPKTECWFRADGELRHTIKDRFLSAAMREALSKQNVGSITEQAMKQFVALGELDRPPVDFVLWTRQSNEEAKRASDSIPRQLATMLRSPILDTLQPTDRIWVFVEMASSSRHALSERRLYSSMPRKRPVQLLTVNPDRLTRRSDEVAVVLRDVEEGGGHWFTSGITQQDGHRPQDWVEVTVELQVQLERTIAVGMDSCLSPTLHLADPARSPKSTSDGFLLATRPCHNSTQPSRHGEERLPPAQGTSSRASSMRPGPSIQTYPHCLPGVPNEQGWRSR